MMETNGLDMVYLNLICNANILIFFWYLLFLPRKCYA